MQMIMSAIVFCRQTLKKIWRKPKGENMKNLMILLPLIFCAGCANLSQQYDNNSQYTTNGLMFPFITYQEAEFAGMPFYVTTAVQPNSMLKPQVFILNAWKGKKSLGIIGKGTLQEDGIVWINFNEGKFQTEAMTKYLFIVMPEKKENEVLVRQIVFLADRMLEWDGSDPMNPPE